MLSSQKATLEFLKNVTSSLHLKTIMHYFNHYEGGDTLGNFVARSSCRKQIAQCVVRILLRATRGTPLMFRGNKVAWNRQLVYSGQHVACNKLCATLSPMTHLASYPGSWLRGWLTGYDTLCDLLPATLLRCCSNKVA